jgi:ATP synthase protein I
MGLEPSAYKSLGAYGTLGLEFVLSVVLGLYGGRWLDQKLGMTGGQMTIAGVVLGAIIGFRAIWRVAKQAERDVTDPPGTAPPQRLPRDSDRPPRSGPRGGDWQPPSSPRGNEGSPLGPQGKEGPTSGPRGGEGPSS